ncbi:MAG: DUF4437 domain-containing protein [Actinobacteria bacterium]|nr:DUF4437 domain-containing protein [Actinomycetota bacterium]
MRPHVELIHEDDYIWHPAEFPHATGDAVQRVLSADEEDGSASLRVDFLTDFARGEGYHLADTEWFVLEGEITIGSERFEKGGYLHAPKGGVVPAISAKKGTRILLYREFGDWGFEPSSANADWAREKLIILDTEAMEWLAVDKPGPKPGLFIKMLHRNEETGFYSRLIWAAPGWDDHRLAHHPCYEEAFTISGSMIYNFGHLLPGTYFFRPAWVKHGHFISHEPDGCTWLIRSDGDLTNYYTTNERVIVEATPENYDPQTQGPVLTGIPVRSKSTGDWSGEGR